MPFAFAITDRPVPLAVKVWIILSPLPVNVPLTNLATRHICIGFPEITKEVRKRLGFIASGANFHVLPS